MNCSIEKLCTFYAVLYFRYYAYSILYAVLYFLWDPRCYCWLLIVNHSFDLPSFTSLSFWCFWLCISKQSIVCFVQTSCSCWMIMICFPSVFACLTSSIASSLLYCPPSVWYNVKLNLFQETWCTPSILDAAMERDSLAKRPGALLISSSAKDLFFLIDSSLFRENDNPLLASIPTANYWYSWL